MHTVLVLFLPSVFCLSACSNWELSSKKPWSNTVVNSTVPDMVLVNGGTFQMGGNDGNLDEKPIHSVLVKSFNIGRYEVTVKQYQDFCTATARRFPLVTSQENWHADSPVVYITWNDANAYCSWLSQKTNKSFRLPTEAEWEYAAQDGKSESGFRYAGSDTPEAVAWFGSNTNLITPGTRLVGQKNPNQLGIFDMSGNAWEWCSDWYGGYPVSAVTNPLGPASGSKRVMRGGSFFDYAVFIRIKCRYGFDPESGSNVNGFRVVQDIY